MDREDLIDKYLKNHGTGALYTIEGVGPRRVIVRYLMTSRRYYVKRWWFDRNVKSGMWEITDKL